MRAINVVVTDFGELVMQPAMSEMFNSAPRRRDGRLDRRFKASKELDISFNRLVDEQMSEISRG
jgi:hypothetical protein